VCVRACQKTNDLDEQRRGSVVWWNELNQQKTNDLDEQRRGSVVWWNELNQQFRL
jgi:hypothetical protein